MYIIELNYYLTLFLWKKIHKKNKRFLELHYTFALVQKIKVNLDTD